MDAGGIVIELLLQGSGSAPPTEDEVRAWVTTHDLETTTVGAVDARPRVVFADREVAFIIDLDTMTVLWKQSGLYANPSLFVTSIDAMLVDYL